MYGNSTGQAQHTNYDHDMSAPRLLHQSSQASSVGSSDGDSNIQQSANGQSPYQTGSTPSLPRYTSGTNLAHPSPLNPSAPRQQRTPAGSSAAGLPYGASHAGAHPLSNQMYLDSSPTLAGSEQNIQEEKVRLNPNGQGDYLAGSVPHRDVAGGQAQYRGAPRVTGLAAVYRAWSGNYIADNHRDDRHIKLPRLGYLDGIKFVAAWVILNGTLFDAAITNNNDYSPIQRNSPLYIVRSTGLGWSFLLLLLGRSLVTPLWDVPVPAGPNSSGPAKTKTALISWARLTRAMLVRPFRFILPVLVIVAVQWGLRATNKTSNCTRVGMDEPYWNLINSFAGYATLVYNLFTVYEADTLAGQTFAGNLWTSPWFFVASYAVYVTHMMLGNLSSNRYWIYGVMAFFSWTTYNYIFLALIGLVFADMHAHGHLHRIRTKWPKWQRLSLHALLIAIALVFQWVPIVRRNVNSGLATINVQNHTELSFCDAVFAACWMFCIETSGIAQLILGNVVFRTLGRFSAGMVLLAPALTFTVIPDIALSLSQHGSSGSTVLGVSWVVLFFVGLGLAVVFHFAVELPSKLVGELFAEAIEKSGAPPVGASSPVNVAAKQPAK